MDYAEAEDLPGPNSLSDAPEALSTVPSAR